jgi:hypothetical protein
MCWSATIVSVCREYHYTPEQVRKLTLYQLAMLCEDPKEIEQRMKSSAIEENEKAQKILTWYRQRGIEAL